MPAAFFTLSTVRNMNIQEKVSEMRESQKYRRRFDFVREFTVIAGKADSEAIALPSEGPFEQIAYNITHGVQGDGTAPVKLRFRSQADNSNQSNDMIPIQLIATPGAPNTPRYGAREFWHFYPANDTLSIDWDGRALTTDIKVSIAFSGWLYPGSK